MTIVDFLWFLTGAYTCLLLREVYEGNWTEATISLVGIAITQIALHV